MTHEQPPADEPSALIDIEILQSYRQGDFLALLTELPVVTASGVRVELAPEGAVLISQTCDIVRSTPRTVQVARLARLANANEARMARDGKMPRFVHTPELGEDAFADLDIIATIDKDCLKSLARRDGILKVDDARKFGRAVGRRPGRFAFPDEVGRWLAKLTDLIGTRSRKPSSPQGALLDAVVEVRVEAPDNWGSGPPWHLTLVIIVRPGTLPTFVEDEWPVCPDELKSWLYGPETELKRSSSDIAVRLTGDLTNEERHYLWEAFGESWAVVCQPPASDRELGSFTAEIVSDDEFTTHRYRRSERLDIDHLSPPAPF